MLNIFKSKKQTKKKTSIKPMNDKVSFGEALKYSPEASKVKKTTTAKKKVVKPAGVPKTQTGMTKDVMVEFNAKTEKWVIRTSGSAKALKSFATQQDAITQGRLIAKNNHSELRIKGKDGKVRDSSTHRK